MAYKRIILELGTGNDLYGEDYSKAARRAVQDALHHSSLILFRSLGIDKEGMRIKVTIGVQHPERVDKESVATEIPFGAVEVSPVTGGLNIVDEENATTSVIATAAIAVYLDLPDQRYAVDAG